MEINMKKFYIIDDDVNYAFSLKAKLSATGFKAEIIPNIISCEEVILDIKKYWPDFIILEPALYIIDGLKLLYDIRRGEGAVRAPIFIYTNSNNEEIKNRASNYGAEYYFTKNNLIIDDLIEKINKIILNKDKILI